MERHSLGELENLTSQEFLDRFINNFYLPNKYGEIIITNISVIGEIRINEKYLKDKSKIIFGINCHFLDKFYLNHKNLSLLEFRGVCFRESCYLSINMEGSIHIFESYFTKKLDFWNNKVFRVEIKDSIFKKQTTFSNNKLSEIYIDNNHFSESLLFKENSVSNEILIRNTKNKTYIENITIMDSNNYVVGLSYEKVNIRTLAISGTIESSKTLNFTNLDLSNIIFLQLINNGKLYFRDINKNKNFESHSIGFNQSDLGDCNLLNCNFYDFEINFSSSKIQKLFISGSKLTTPNNIRNIPGESDPLKYIDCLNQLKKIFENNGDFLTSTKLHERELEVLKYIEIKDYNNPLKLIYSQLKKMYELRGDSVKSLEYQAKELEIHMNSPKISWSERLNLQFAYWSNNFGTDWIKAIKFLIIGAAYFYFLVILSQNCEFENSLNTVWGLLSGFFEFLNPIRKLNSLTINGNEEILNNKARIADFFARIFIAFAEYQLIQAFRKYGKK
ncbi:MAG: hypothetical protein CFE21_19830 [Bacteroidetes bacterium B1(2017)]|nr:MAG: hypothetical protein CFE21_19830 [Bacteroidetes bacterium B1(2017)]